MFLADDVVELTAKKRIFLRYQTVFTNRFRSRYDQLPQFDGDVRDGHGLPTGKLLPGSRLGESHDVFHLQKVI